MNLKYVKPSKYPVWGKLDKFKVAEEKHILKDGNVTLEVNDTNLPCNNHIEMAGFETASIISYKIGADRSLKLYRYVAFPQCRIAPNDDKGALDINFNGVKINVGNEKVSKVTFDGCLNFNSYNEWAEITRVIAPAKNIKALVETMVVKNVSESKQIIKIDNNFAVRNVSKLYTINEGYKLYTYIYMNGDKIPNFAVANIEAGETKEFVIGYSTEILDREILLDEIENRRQFVEDNKKYMVIETPDEKINKAIELCKLRVNESIYKTEEGYMHSNGNGCYGTVWSNYECEYTNPLFAYMGYDIAKEQAINCFKMFAETVSETKAIKSNIVLGGKGKYKGLDRGDTSLFLYGLSRFLLANGDKALAEEFMPAIRVATTYVLNKIDDNGIVLSKTDEFNERFFADKANLYTSSITYDAMLTLSYLQAELGNTEESAVLAETAEKIKNGIEIYFGAKVEGYDTYRHCKKDKKLRSYICMPLTVGIDSRKNGTIEALLSPKLFKSYGITARSNEPYTWDKFLINTIKGMFIVGEAERAYKLLDSYTSNRLLGKNMPYPVESTPYGNMAQTAAESALYVRLFTEGVLGFRPTGFNSFELKPSLPPEWNEISVKDLIIGGKPTDITVIREEEKYTIKYGRKKYSIENNQKLVIKTNAKKENTETQAETEKEISE